MISDSSIREVASDIGFLPRINISSVGSERTSRATGGISSAKTSSLIFSRASFISLFSLSRVSAAISRAFLRASRASESLLFPREVNASPSAASTPDSGWESLTGCAGLSDNTGGVVSDKPCVSAAISRRSCLSFVLNLSSSAASSAAFCSADLGNNTLATPDTASVTTPTALLSNPGPFFFSSLWVPESTFSGPFSVSSVCAPKLPTKGLEVFFFSSSAG